MCTLLSMNLKNQMTAKLTLYVVKHNSKLILSCGKKNNMSRLV